jgi:hypothetical protein
MRRGCTDRASLALHLEAYFEARRIRKEASLEYVRFVTSWACRRTLFHPPGNLWFLPARLCQIVFAGRASLFTSREAGRRRREGRRREDTFNTFPVRSRREDGGRSRAKYRPSTGRRNITGCDRAFPLNIRHWPLSLSFFFFAGAGLACFPRPGDLACSGELSPSRMVGAEGVRSGIVWLVYIGRAC